MSSGRNQLARDLIGLLRHGPSSIAATYAFLVRHCGYPRTLDVRELLDVLYELEQQHLVHLWLIDSAGNVREPAAADRSIARERYVEWLNDGPLHGVSVDEIGLWAELTDRGRDEADRDSQDQPPPQWMVDDYPLEGRLVVHAEDPDQAYSLLETWQSRYAHVAGSRVDCDLATGVDYVLRNGATVSHGVRLECRYESTSSERAIDQET